MEFINDKIIELLTRDRSELCISVYMPTHRIWNQTDQDLLRYKNIVKQLERELSSQGIINAKREKLLKPFHSLQNDSDYWSSRQDGVALFATEKEFYHIKLPIHFEESIIIGEQFHILPLIHAITDTYAFYILLLDQRDMKLFRSHHYVLRPVTVPSLPKNVGEAVGYDNPGRNQQYRQGMHSGASGGGANYHGMGTDTDATKQKENITEYFRISNEAVMKVIGSDNIPMVLAGVDYLHHLYREVNSYPHLLGKGITRKVTEGEEQLYYEASELVKPQFDKILQDALIQYGNLTSSGRTSVDTAEIVSAAFSKRISHLFLNPVEKQWGRFDFRNFDVIVNNDKKNGDVELIGLSVSRTIENNGIVFLLNKDRMPDGKPMAAIFRY